MATQFRHRDIRFVRIFYCTSSSRCQRIVVEKLKNYRVPSSGKKEIVLRDLLTAFPRESNPKGASLFICFSILNMVLITRTLLCIKVQEFRLRGVIDTGKSDPYILPLHNKATLCPWHNGVRFTYIIIKKECGENVKKIPPKRITKGTSTLILALYSTVQVYMM